MSGSAPADALTAPASAAEATGHRRAFSRVLPAVVTAVAIVALGPYFAWGTPLYFRGFIGLLAILFLLSASAGVLTISRRDLSLAALCVLLLTYFAAHRRGGIYDPSSGWLALVLFVLLPDRLKSSSFRCFAWVFALSLLPAMIVWILSSAGVDVPWSYLYAKRLDDDFLLGTGGSYYRHYLGSVVRSGVLWTFPSGSTLFRLHGMYEEPGVVGTVAGLLLAAGRFQFKGRAENVILLVGGVMSLSLAFFAILYLSLLWRHPAITVMLTALAVTVVLAIDLPTRVPAVRFILFNRLTIRGYAVVGDNRVTPLFGALYDAFWRADVRTRLLGSPSDITSVVNTGAFSFKVLIYQYGLLGFAGLLAVLSSALLAISRQRDALILLAIMLLSIYQRPNVMTLPYIIILLGGAASLEVSRRGRPAAAVAPAAA